MRLHHDYDPSVYRCHTVKIYLDELESLQPGTQSHDDKLQQVIDHLSPDSESEEREELPLLEDRLGETKSKEEAARFSKLPARFGVMLLIRIMNLPFRLFRPQTTSISTKQATLRDYHCRILDCTY
jgi:hypothetical protein